MTHVFVFIGPTISRADVLDILPTAEVRPPAEHGSLLGLDPPSDSTVVIIDGVFHGAAPIRHKEILRVLERGVRVLGAGSMGALRASELHTFGMEGVGSVYRWYRHGLVTGDDEVALLHTTSEEGYRNLSVPFIHVRAGLRRACCHGEISSSEEQILIQAGKRLYFGSRTVDTIVRAARARGLPAATADRVTAILKNGLPDVKGRDARLLLRRLQTGQVTPLPRPRVPATSFVFDWEQESRKVPGRSALSAIDVLRFCQVMAVDFPEFRHRTLVATLCADNGLSGIVVDDDNFHRREQAVVQRFRRGIGPFSGGPDPTVLQSWRHDPEMTNRSDAEIASTLTTLLRWTPGVLPTDALLDGLLQIERLDRICDQTTRALGLRVHLGRDTGFESGRMTYASIAQSLVEIWGRDDDDELLRRGIVSRQELVAWADRFGPYVLTNRIRPFRLLDKPSGAWGK